MLGGMRVSQVLWEHGSGAQSPNLLYTLSKSLFFYVSLTDLFFVVLEGYYIFVPNYDLSADG